jgi:hypothetical protein
MLAILRFSVAPLCGLFLSAPFWTRTHAPASEGFASIQAAAKAGDSAALEKLLPAEAMAQSSPDAAKTKEWRESLAKEIAGAKLVGVREKDDDAVVRFKLPPAADERELALHFTADAWRIASARSYIVKGKMLDAARGAKPQKLTLKAYAKPDAFEGSAYSFTHVTGAPKECKNRMDAWYCGNSDLHAGKGSQIADVGAIELEKVDGLPAGAAWSSTVTPKPGETYVVHCSGSDRHDFYVKLRVTEKKPDSIALEWTLLSDGLNSPKSLSKPQPLESRDGADGSPGMCEKKGG